jgi:hypothetical protein
MKAKNKAPVKVQSVEVKSKIPPHPRPQVKHLERVTFGGVVRSQHPPFFEVNSRWTRVEWTDRRAEAHDAFNQVAAPKTLAIVDANGHKTLLESA